ncbi:hypothetical protein [Paracoccus sp. S3-43]|uniref:hypothetical protein n=1 Tax=Paracoccus sp. S3-43 TaxID=3030011 RepID=UPI0023AF391A|nr:hypothetical protein [Paracoccus sp. S3-43]WEF25844.1 hypothetical protein PXD02_08045 [Paracoccus sp. S3-43]
MFWWGRINALLAIFAFGGSFIAIISQTWELLALVWILVILLRIALKIVNLLYTAITGRALIYDVQVQGHAPRRRRHNDEGSWTMSSLAPWRRLGAALECRLDVRFALRRVSRAAVEETPPVMRMPSAEALALFDREVPKIVDIAKEFSDG